MAESYGPDMRVSPTSSVVPAQSAPPRAELAQGGERRPDRPCLTELRLSAYAVHRQAGLPLAPLTLITGPSGSGKTSALRAYGALARLGAGASLGEVFPHPLSCVPDRARPDAQRRRGFRIGCTADGPEGPVRLDLAIQAEPELRIVGERLTSGGLVLLETALRDPSRRAVDRRRRRSAGRPPSARRRRAPGVVRPSCRPRAAGAGRCRAGRRGAGPG